MSGFCPRVLSCVAVGGAGKVIDFSLAVKYPLAEFLHPQAVYCTRTFRPPELLALPANASQAQRHASLGVFTDLWSGACTIFEALSGAPLVQRMEDLIMPYPGPKQGAIYRRVMRQPACWHHFFWVLLAKDPPVRGGWSRDGGLWLQKHKVLHAGAQHYL